MKLTTPRISSAPSATRRRLSDVRTGFGFDIHQFGDGDHVMLGGVRIPHPRSLRAIPTPTWYCMRWSTRSSARSPTAISACIFRPAMSNGAAPPRTGSSPSRSSGCGARRRIAHLDVTVVCEAPRVGPHRDAIRARIAEIAGIPIDRVGVKATTSEKMGFTGRGEGMAAFANATIRLPWTVP